MAHAFPFARLPACSATARWVNLVTLHWYKATREAPNTAVSLLDEAPLRREMDHLRRLVQVRGVLVCLAGERAVRAPAYKVTHT